MTPTGRESALKWINAHAGKTVEIASRTHAVRVRGRIHRVEELDACSTTVYECDIDTGALGLQVALSLHDDTVALHLNDSKAASSQEEDAGVTLMVSIPYREVEFGLPGKKAASAPQREQAEPQEPEFSPYELLHPRSD